MTTHTELAAPLPCPFCGSLHTLKVVSAEDLANEGEDEPEPWEHSPSFAVVCDASRPNGPGGCGSQGGFKPTEAEAVANWNRRAALESTERLAGGGEPGEAEMVCQEAYQVVGSLLADLGQFETERGQKILDNLGDAKLVHNDVLPWPSFVSTPPPQAERVPLTEAQKDELWYRAHRDESRRAAFVWYFKGIADAERAHGITPKEGA